MSKITIITLATGLTVVVSALYFISQNNMRRHILYQMSIPKKVSAEIENQAPQVTASPEETDVVTTTPVRYPSMPPTATQPPKKLDIQAFSYDTPDGKKSLIFKRQSDGTTTTYHVSISAKSEATEPKEVFTQVEKPGTSIEVPYNTWSPDNLYFLLKENDGNTKNFLLVSAQGKDVSDHDKTVNITQKFAKKLPDYVLEDVTGWAAPYLVIVNTLTPDLGKGPSFWFDVSTQTFIQLANRFN